MKLSLLDCLVVILYVLFCVIIGVLSANKNNHGGVTARSYFLAGRSLRWWNVGASLIASNMTVAMVISLAGSGYAIGIAIASYEWFAAISLLLVGKFILPVYMKHRIYTLAQWLAYRYDIGVSMMMSLIWLFFYIFIGLIPVLWLAAIVIQLFTGISPTVAMILLGVAALAYSLYGGLQSIVKVDLVQVIVLLSGTGIVLLVAIYLLGDEGGFLFGIEQLPRLAPEHFILRLPPDHPHWQYLPGDTLLFGGIWILLISYWGFNQFVMQRALAAKNLREAQAGIAFAAIIKLFTPFLMIVPGIIAWVLFPDLEPADLAYPTLIGLIPIGVSGLIFAGLVGAAISASGALLNSLSTLFVLDIYRRLFPRLTETKLVSIGRRVSIFALVVAIVLAELLLADSPQVFQYIQIIGGFLAPGFTVLFLLGMYWSRMTVLAAYIAMASSLFLSVIYLWLFPEMPFLDRIGITSIFCLGLTIVTSLLQPAKKNSSVYRQQKFATEKELETAVTASDSTSFGDDPIIQVATGQQPANLLYSPIDYSTSPKFNGVSMLIILLISIIYIFFW